MENSSEELQDQSEELCSRPSLSRAKKSWGFRRTTIAKREFLEQVGELAHSPPPVRKTRSRRGTQIPLTTPETEESQRHTPSAISVLDGLEWSAPSSPVAEETKPATETFNPSLWQDCGSAFHTAFSLLGGGESFQVEMPDALAVPDTAEAGDSIEPYDSCVEESAAPKNDFPDGNHDGEMLLGEIGEMLMQKDEQESRCTSIREVKGRKGRGRICATDESAMPNNEDSPGGEMLLREFGEMLTRKVGKDQRYTTIRGVRSRKGRGTICAADESTVASNEDSPDAITHSVLGDLGVDSDLVLIPPQEGGCSDCEMLLSETAEMLTQKSGQGDRATAVKVGKGRGRQCTTEESAVSSREDSPDITHSGLGDEREDSDVVLISPQEEADSDGENTVMETGKLLAPEVGQEQRDATARGAKGGKARGRKRGRGRGRRKAKGRGKGRGKPGGLQANAVGDELVMLSPTEPEQQVEKLHGTDSPIEISTSPAHSVSSLSPAQRSNSDYICIESDVDQVINETHDQSDDAPKQRDKEVDTNGETPPLSDHDGYDPDAVTCICRQQGNDRFMVRCVTCQEWFHGSCVGISGTEGCKGYVCPTCITKNQSEHQPDCCPQPEDDCCLPKGLTLSRQDEDMAVKREQQAVEDPQMVEEEEERTEAPVINIEPEPQAVMKKDGTLPLCIGPGCPREALPESVYCGTDCILQHAAATMKTLCVPKEPKTRGALQKKPATTTASAKGQRSCGTSKSLGANAEDEDKEKDDDGGQKEAAPPSPCDPPPTGVQATSLPSSKLYTASKMDKTQEVEAPLKQSAEDSAAHGAPSSQPASEAETPQGHSPETPQEPNNGSVPSATRPCPPPNAEQACQVTVSEAPSTSAPSHHQTEALTVRKKAFIIPKKPPAPQPSSSPVLPSTSGQKPSAAPALVNETRNLLVPPAPSAPSSRPSQPNNQIRQSIQKSLVSILVKRVGECGDLKTSESDVVKLVASIEVEMFDIFRNTDSKYMNKYRTIMFNLKDPRNKGLLYGFVRGEISPFRLVRMTQKDMQAIKASDTSEKQTSEAKDSAATAPPVAKVTSVLPKPEAVKVDLPILNPTRPHRSTEQKKSLPPPAAKSRTMQPIQSSALPDILTCMLKDTTSEHKTHIFDLKCKICTGQISSTDDEEPSKKKPRVSETRDRNYPSWRKSTEDDSALPAPPQSPDLDSPPLFIMETSSHLTSDSPVLTIVESPASPTMDSPASPVLESPASPVMDSPASPTPDPPKAFTSKSALMPVVNPAVSMTTMTRRDPRTAANRFSVLPNNQSAPYAPPKETRSVPQMAPGSLPPPPPPSKVVPKSILKPLSADPRFYSALSRSVASGSPSVDETSQFLAKQEILWKGFINMLTVAKFVSKAYLVSGPAENLKVDLPDTIQIGGRILPETVWDYVDKVKSSITKELCVIRFHPATEEEEVAYVSLFSYFSSRRRFGVVASGNRSIKDLYLVPVGANESVPSMLQPLEGPGLETKRPNLLLGLAIIQRTKRSGIFSQETEEKRPKVHLAKDPMWIPKPPVLYGSDRLDVFQPYDPETPANSAVPSSPLRPGSPPAPSSSLTKPSSFISVRPNLSVALSVTAPAAQSPSTSVSDKPPVTPSGDKTPLQTILSSLFGSNPTESTASTNESSTNLSSVKKPPALSQVAATMVDPIVQQYGQKSKIKEIEEENDFDRPYDPEEEYDPAVGYGIPALKSLEKTPAAGPAVSSCVEDDVAYDPEDDTIFADVSSIAAKRPVQTQMSDPSSCDPPVSTQPATPVPTSTASSDGITPNLPSGTVVVSAATLNEQQRMLEELNKQIEEQKRQLKEQEEALRQQREAVGMFMAQFSASDSMMPPPTKTLPLSQMPLLKAQADTKPSEMTDKTVERSPEISANAEKQTVEPQDTSVLNEHTDTLIAEDETNTEVKDGETYSSAGEIEDSDVAYDPEDESFFKEVEDGPFEGNGGKTYDRSLSRRSRSTSHKGSQNSSHSRKRRLSPKRRGHRERDHRRSPSRKRRSSSHSQKRRERDRHRRSDGERSRHRGRGHSERQGRHRKEHNVHRQSLGRRSSSCLSQQDHVSFSPEHQRQASSELELSFTMVPVKNEPDEQMIRSNLGENPDESCTTFSHDLLQKVKVEISDQPASDELLPNPFSNHHDPAQGTSVQANTLIKQQSQIESKIESMIPLREIDPPIRDSPESPDPEPQFAKPSSIEKRDTANAEKMQDASIRFSGPVSRVPGMPSSKSCPDLPFQNNQGKGMTEGRNTELMKGSEKSLNCESSFMRGMSPEVKGLLGLKREAKTPEPGKTHDRPGVNIPQCKNVAEANVLGSGTKNSPDFNISMASGTTVPREDLIFHTDRRIEQTGQEVKPSIPNITSPDWRGPDLPAAGMRNQRCPNTGFGPHVIDPHCSVEGSDMQGHWRGPNRRGPCVVRGRGGPFVQDARKYQPKWRGPSIDDPRQTGQDFMTSGPVIEAPMHERRDPGNPHSRRTDPERGGPNDSQGCGIRGPQGAPFERITPLGEGPVSNGRGQAGPDFGESWLDTEPWFDQRNLPIKGAEAGPGNPQFLGQDHISPEYRGLEPPGYPIDHPGAGKGGLQGPDFRGPEQHLNHPHSAMRGPGCPEVKGPGLDRRSIGGPPQSDRRGPDKRFPFIGNLRPDRMGPGPGHPDFRETEADWRSPPIEASGYMRTSLGGPMGALEPGRIGPPHSESWRPESEISDSNVACPGSERRTSGGQNLIGPEPEYPGAWTSGPGPDFMEMQPETPGPGHHTRRRGREPFRVSDPGSEYQNMEGPESADFRGPGLERRPPVMDQPHNCRGFPDIPRFSLSMPQRSPAMEGCESDRRGSHFGRVKPERPALEGPTHIRRGFRGPEPNRQPCDNRGADIRGREPNRQEQEAPGLRELGDEFELGIRQKDPVPESHRHRRDNWHETEFMGSEPIQGGPDIGSPGSRGPSHIFRGPRRTNAGGPRSETERWKEQNFRDSSLERRGRDLEEQWPNRRVLGLEEHERNLSDGDWKHHRDRSPRFTHESADEQFQHGQEPMEWRGPENRGQKMLQDRPTVQGRGPRGDVTGPDFRSPGLDRDHPGSTREGSSNEMMNQERDQPDRWSSGIAFRGSRVPDNRRKSHDRRIPIMRGPGPDMRVGQDMENDFRPTEFRDKIRGSNMEERQTLNRGPGFETPPLNRRADMDDLERRVPRGPESERAGSESRLFTFEGPEASRRFSDGGRTRSERQGDNMERPTSIREGSEDFRRVNRGPNMRRVGPEQTSVRDLAPDTSGVRHGPGRWDTLTESSRSESRRGKPALRRFNSPSEVPRFQGPIGPPCPGFDQQQQGTQPQGRKAALLPTPTGPICFPNLAVKNPGSFGPEGKHAGCSTPRGRGRGRSLSRDR